MTGYGVFTTDKKGTISSWNAGAQKLFGYKEKEIIGKNASLIFRQKDINKHKLQNELQKVTLKGKVIVERYHVHKDGSEFWASGLIFPLGDEKDISRGFTFIARDLTEKVEFEKRKDDFISTATHELKTPITSMKLYAQVVEQEIKKSGNKSNLRSVVVLNKQLTKVMALMDYLLDVDKIRKGKLELKKIIFDMNKLIKETIEMIQIVSLKHVIIHEGKVNKKIYGDKNRLGQVLANLITNAVKYSPSAEKVIVRSDNNTQETVISVKDFGFGISKTEQSRISGRFFRTSAAIEHKVDGIGLGLYVAKQIIKGHKGKLWFESEVDKGSTFYFSLPQKI